MVYRNAGVTSPDSKSSDRTGHFCNVASATPHTNLGEVQMINPRSEAIFVRNRSQNGFDDKTPELVEYRAAGAFTYVTFSSGKTYRYSADNVIVLRNPERIFLSPHDTVIVRGKVLEAVTEVLRFDSPQGPWWRVFHLGDSGPCFQACSDSELAISRPSEEEIQAQVVLDYWRDVASKLSADDPLRGQYENFRSVPKGSALDVLLQRQPRFPRNWFNSTRYCLSRQTSANERLS